MKALLPLSIILLLLFSSSDTFAGAKTWTGAVSTDWGNAGNWSPATLSLANDDITVPVRSNMPVLSSGTYKIHSLIVQSGASFTQTGGTLSVISASVQISGTVIQTGGSMFTDRDFKLLTGGVFNQSGSSLLHLAKDITTAVTNKFNIASGATVNQSGGTIYVKDYNNSPGVFNQTGASVVFKLSHDWKPGAGSRFNSTAGTVQFTGSAGGGADFAAGTRQFNNIIVDAGVDPKFGETTNSQIFISGNFTNNNADLNTGDKATFTFNGTGNQNIYSAVTKVSDATFGHLVIASSGGTVALTSNANFKGNISIKSGTFDLNTYTSNRTSTGGTLTIAGGSRMRLAGTTGGQTGSNFPLRVTPTIGSTATVEYYGSGQTIYAPLTYGNLTLSAAGTKTAPAALNIAGNFNLSTGTFAAGSYTHNVGGNWTMSSGTFTNTGSTINFNGTVNQAIASTGAFNRIIINKTTGKTNLTTDVTATTLTFTKGNVVTGTNKMIIPNGGSVTGAGQTTGWVNGNLQKYMGSTAGGTFEVGGVLYYTPVSTTFNSGGFTAGSLIARTTAANHPQIGSSSDLRAKNISRHWNLSTPASGGVVFGNSSITFNWNANDNYSPLVAGSLRAGHYTSASGWTLLGGSGTPTSTSMTASPVNVLGDYAIGEVSTCTLSSGFSYSATELCTNGGVATVILNAGATSGTYTSTPLGLSLDATTGAITLATSTPGIYTITNTVIGLCTSNSPTTIQVIAGPSATISYGGTSFCQTGGTASATITGTTGGTFSSTYGLSLNDVTGQIDLASSTPGTYTVTYTLISSNACTAPPATTTITITPPNYANIAYPADAYCLNGGTAAVSFEGTAGGTFSSTAGLSLNATTGAITLASSTAATYTVTYSGGAANGCAAFTGTTTIVITSSSPGTISYTGSPLPRLPLPVRQVVCFQVLQGW